MRQCLVVLCLVLWASQVDADEVVLTDSRGNEMTRSGSVLDYSGEQLTLQTSSGREIVIPAARVQQVKADWLPSHREADARYAQRDFDSALRSYRNAFDDESRRWVKRKLLAQVVRCQRNLGQIRDACRNFASLFHDDQSTPYFSAIPLAWNAQHFAKDLQALAQSWLGSENEPAQRLMAASWLLSSSADRASCIDTLNDLAKHTADGISGLAIAQLWRTQLVVVKELQLENWSRHIQAMPIELRGGPYYLLGKAYARFDRQDEAVLAFMRLPTLYGEDVPLAQLALFESAMLLQESGHNAEAIRLYRKTIQLGGETSEATRARQQLASLLN